MRKDYMATVSVIMSAYNKSDKTKRAIESVLKQTYKDFELIVVDDCSTDDTQDVVEAFSHPTDDSGSKLQDIRIKYLRLDKNFGNDTRPKNIGIKNSTGKYIAFLDNDNEYLADHLMILVKDMEKSGTDVVYGDRLVMSDDPDITIEPEVGIASDWNAGLLFERNYIDTSDVLIKREALFLVGGFDERYEKYVDWNLWIRMCKAGCTFHHIAKVITNYYLSKTMKSLRVKDEVGRMPFGDKAPQQVFRPAWDGFEVEIQLPYLNALPDPKVAVYTLTMNRLDYTKRMYESFKKADYPFTWIVIDQGSTDGTQEWLKSLKVDKTVKRIEMMFNGKNTGISHGSNQALDIIEKEDFDFIIKIDNDCEITADMWLSRLLFIFQAHWQIVLSPYVEGLIDNPGGAPRIAYKKLRKHLIGVTKHIGGIFTMTHKNAYRGFRWNEEDFLHSLQDVVFTQDVQKRGYLCGYVEDMKCNHQRTTDGQKNDYPLYFEQRKYEKTHTYQDISIKDGFEKSNVEEKTK